MWLTGTYLARNLVMNKNPTRRSLHRSEQWRILSTRARYNAHIALLLDLKTAVTIDGLSTIIQSAIVMTRLPGIQVTPDTHPLPDDPAIIPDTDSWTVYKGKAALPLPTFRTVLTFRPQSGTGPFIRVRQLLPIKEDNLLLSTSLSKTSLVTIKVTRFYRGS